MAEPTVPIELSTPSLSLERFHCDSFEVRLSFDTGDMDVSRFLKAIEERGLSARTEDSGDRDVWLTFGSHDDAWDYHAHLRVFLRKDDSGRAELSYHPSSYDDKGSNPFVVDCAQWFGGFLKEPMMAHLHVNYTFGPSFTSAISLNFPLVTSEKPLAGALVSGLALVFPNERTAIIQSGKDEIYLFVRETTRIDFSTFEPTKEIERLSPFVGNLVKESKK
jgi:hypothetical protein